MANVFEKRMETLTKLGLMYHGGEHSFIKEDFNMHETEVRFDSHEIFDEKIAKIKDEMERRKEFEAYGDEWVKEIMNYKKEEIIIKLLKPALIKKGAFRCCLTYAEQQFSQYAEAHGTSKCEAYQQIQQVLKDYPF